MYVVEVSDTTMLSNEKQFVPKKKSIFLEKMLKLF
jgi:hypothetical protein